MEFNPAKLNPPQPEEPPAPTREWPKRKRWKVAKRTTMGKYNAIRNMLIEDHFVRVRKAVRLLYAQHSEYFYDNDQREDLSESTVSMHSLACDTFYMILDCNYCDEYVVEYDIENSPFKEEITKLISKGPMYSIAKQITHEPSMAAHFQYMRSYHNDNPKHFSYLNIKIEQQD